MTVLPIPADGIFLVDKPTSWTSHDVVAWVRRQTGVKRVGHAGTLDPLATGLLIVLVGREATKRQSEFMKQEKFYQVRAQLGWESDTYDRDGKCQPVCEWTQLKKITPQIVTAALTQFIGTIEQRVPAYSAVKKHGVKLYEKARAGETDFAELPVRTITIYSIELTQFFLDEEKQSLVVELSVHCGSGTYIRSLVHDLGEKLGTGAMVSELRRTAIGEHQVSNAFQVITD